MCSWSGTLPVDEKKHYTEYRKMRKEEKPIKMWWFSTRLKQVVQEYYPADKDFIGSDDWFTRLVKANVISLRRKTRARKKKPSSARHQSIESPARTKEMDLSVKLSVNMDQTLLSSIVEDNKMYETKGTEEV